MGEHHALGSDLLPVHGDVGVVEMKPDRLLEKVALGNEEIGAVGQNRHLPRPLTVACIRDHLIRHLDPDGRGVGFAGVDGRIRCHLEQADLHVLLKRQVNIADGEFGDHDLHPWHQGRRQRFQALRRVLWSSYCEGSVAFGGEHGVNQEKGDPAAMVTMEVRQKDHVDGIVRYAQAFKGDETRCSEV